MSSPRRSARCAPLAALAIQALLLAVLAGGCARDSGLPPVGAAATPEQVEAESRAILRSYLAETRDFGPGDSTLAYQVVERGDALVPALAAMLTEAGTDAERYHLIRLGCIGIRSGDIPVVGDASLPGALERARSEIRPHTSLRHYADAELRSCTVEEVPAVAAGSP